MIVYKVDNFNDWHKHKDNIEIIPIMSKKGYFLTMNLVDLWSELDWDSLEKIELSESDLIKNDEKDN